MKMGAIIFIHGGFSAWYTFMSDAILTYCSTFAILTRQNLISTAVPSTFTFDVMGQRNKIGDITF